MKTSSRHPGIILYPVLMIVPQYRRLRHPLILDRSLQHHALTQATGLPPEDILPWRMAFWPMIPALLV
jgi:hypothetical protein